MAQPKDSGPPKDRFTVRLKNVFPLPLLTQYQEGLVYKQWFTAEKLQGADSN